MNIVFRKMRPEDNEKLKEIIVSTLYELGVTGPGCTSEDPELEDFHSYYKNNNGCYCVLEDKDSKQIFGGGGYARLKGTQAEDSICEIQKVYFLKESRGLGLGKKLVSCLVERAKKYGYKEAYLETHDNMKSATKLYEKLGFKYLDKPKGNTGHFARTKCMSLSLDY